MLFLAYRLTDFDIFAPMPVFCEMFLVAELLCACYSNRFDIIFKASTVAIIIIGMLAFLLATVISKIFHDKRNKRKKYKTNEKIVLSNPIKIFFIILQIFVTLDFARYLFRVVAAFGFAGTGILSLAGRYHDITLFDSSNFLKLGFSAPISYSVLYPVCLAFAYLGLYIQINNWLLTKKIDRLLLVDEIIFAFGELLTGGRTPLFRYITAGIFIYITCIDSKKRLVKAYFKILGIAIVGVFILVGMVSIIGRENMAYSGFVDNIFVYLGAPIANLNDYHRPNGLGTGQWYPDLWGEQTFHNVYQYLGDKLHISKYIYSLNLPFNYHEGHYFGNVYTTFYQFVYDFDMAGVFPLTFAMALFYCCYYKKIQNKRNIISVSIYSFVFNDLIMLVFSNRFYETVFSIQFVKYLFCFLAIYNIIAHKVRFKGAKLIYSKKRIFQQ